MKHPAVFTFGVVVALVVARRWRKLEPTLKAGGTVVAALAILIGFDIIPLPNVEAIVEEIGSTLGTWTYLFVGVFAFLETGAFVGLIAPGETVVIVGGVVAGQGEIDLLTLIGITWLAAVAGDVCSLLLGRRLGRGFLERHGHRVAITEERLRHVEGFFERYGGVTILIGRFLGLVRALAPFLAGASKMPLRRFLPYDVVAAGLWATTFCVLGYVFWHSLDQVTRYAGTGAFALGTIVTIVVAIVFLRKVARDAEYRARVAGWIAERPGGEHFLRVAVPVWRRALGPSRFVVDRITPGQLGLEFTTLLALAGVGTFAFVYFGDQPGTRLDTRAFDLADDVRTAALTDVAKVYTELGSSLAMLLLITATAGWALLRRRIHDAAALGAGALLLLAAVGMAKDGYGRERPSDGLIVVDSFAYPSGHAAYGVALVACAIVLVRGGRRRSIRYGAVIVAAILALGVALSRVYLRAHFLTDTIGGVGLALAIFGGCGLAALAIAHLRDNPQP